MIRSVVPFKHWHYEWVLGAPSTDSQGIALDVSTLSALEAHNSWTCVLDGDPIACGGTMQQWPGRHIAWAYFTERTGPHMKFLTSVASDVLSKAKGRVEMTVRSDFELGHRWARMLGFKVETPRMERFGPQGEDHAAYVRFN